MVDESLKRLLDAEAKAELIISSADTERQQAIEQARHDAHEAEQQHAVRVSEIHASFLAQAEQRAKQTIAELKRRYSERSAALQRTAEQRRQQSLATAIALLTSPEQPEP
ncbi:MAG: ATPase [Sideroxydans sp.]|nr:ATPase [Sideroxydans sp.]